MKNNIGYYDIILPVHHLFTNSEPTSSNNNYIQIIYTILVSKTNKFNSMKRVVQDKLIMSSSDEVVC